MALKKVNNKLGAKNIEKYININTVPLSRPPFVIACPGFFAGRMPWGEFVTPVIDNVTMFFGTIRAQLCSPKLPLVINLVVRTVYNIPPRISVSYQTTS